MTAAASSTPWRLPLLLLLLLQATACAAQDQVEGPSVVCTETGMALPDAPQVDAVAVERGVAILNAESGLIVYSVAWLRSGREHFTNVDNPSIDCGRPGVSSNASASREKFPDLADGLGADPLCEQAFYGRVRAMDVWTQCPAVRLRAWLGLTFPCADFGDLDGGSSVQLSVPLRSSSSPVISALESRDSQNFPVKFVVADVLRHHGQLYAGGKGVEESATARLEGGKLVVGLPASGLAVCSTSSEVTCWFNLGEDDSALGAVLPFVDLCGAMAQQFLPTEPLNRTETWVFLLILHILGFAAVLASLTWKHKTRTMLSLATLLFSWIRRKCDSHGYSPLPDDVDLSSLPESHRQVGDWEEITAPFPVALQRELSSLSFGGLALFAQVLSLIFALASLAVIASLFLFASFVLRFSSLFEATDSTLLPLLSTPWAIVSILALSELLTCFAILEIDASCSDESAPGSRVWISTRVFGLWLYSFLAVFFAAAWRIALSARPQNHDRFRGNKSTMLTRKMLHRSSLLVLFVTVLIWLLLVVCTGITIPSRDNWQAFATDAAFVIVTLVCIFDMCVGVCLFSRRETRLYQSFVRSEGYISWQLARENAEITEVQKGGHSSSSVGRRAIAFCWTELPDTLGMLPVDVVATIADFAFCLPSIPFNALRAPVRTRAWSFPVCETVSTDFSDGDETDQASILEDDTWDPQKFISRSDPRIGSYPGLVPWSSFFRSRAPFMVPSIPAHAEITGSEENSTPFVAIDHGSCTLKAGLLAQPWKLGVVPSLSASYLSATCDGSSACSRLEVVAGRRNIARAETVPILNPVIERGLVTDWDGLERLYHELFYNELRLSPEEHGVALLLPLLTPLDWFGKTAIQLLNESFETPRLSLQKSAPLALYSVGQANGFVLSCGDGLSQACAVLDGQVVAGTERRTHLAGADITRAVQILHRNRISPEVARDVKERFCSLFPQHQGRNTGCSGGDPELDIRVRAAGEILFGSHQPSLDISSEVSIPRLIESSLDGLNAAELPLRRSFGRMRPHRAYESLQVRQDIASTLLVTGGTARMPGFIDRLSTELNSRALVVRGQISGQESRAVLAPMFANEWSAIFGMLAMGHAESHWLERSWYMEHGPDRALKELIS